MDEIKIWLEDNAPIVITLVLLTLVSLGVYKVRQDNRVAVAIERLEELRENAEGGMTFRKPDGDLIHIFSKWKPGRSVIAECQMPLKESDFVECTPLVTG